MPVTSGYPNDEEREAMVKAMRPRMGDDCTTDELRAYAVALWRAGFRRAAEVES